MNPRNREVPAPLYTEEQEQVEQKRGLQLTEEQKDAIRAITLGITEVDEAIRTMAVEDVIHTLENGHPLNKLISGSQDEIIGYIACEDFIPREAYIKYFGTTRNTGRNAMREIPRFIEYAREQGYLRLNFHGWNDRLNHVLERYGFERLRTDNMAGYSVDFYEKALTEEKSVEQVEAERRKAFEDKYISELNQRYSQTLNSFSKENRPQKEQAINSAYQTLSGRLAGVQDFEFGERQQIILKLKLARHLISNETIDLSDLFDAIVESPKFINTDKGSLHRLLEVHQEKTLQKIAEIRKARAEMGDSEASNPWENLIQTDSGKYYVARLLNMPHLEEESEYMRHCVGTSDSYINQMKRGEIEILSFRTAPKFNNRAGRLEGDTPVITMEYNLKTKVIEQMKKQDDEYLQPNDPYYDDVIDALKKLRTTQTDTGQLRDFRKISESELSNIKVKDYHVLTERGEVHFRDFNPEESDFYLKLGDMELTPEMPKTDAAKIIRIVAGIKCEPQEIALGKSEITESTKVYIGEFSIDMLQSDIEHIYVSFPEREIRRGQVEIGGKTRDQLEKEMEAAGVQISTYAKDMLHSKDFVTAQNKEKLDYVRLTVADLGFTSYPTTDQLYARAEELGLELLPAEFGPNYRLQNLDQPEGDWFYTGMKQIADSDGDPDVFDLGRRGDDLWLDGCMGAPGLPVESRLRVRVPFSQEKLKNLVPC